MSSSPPPTTSRGPRLLNVLLVVVLFLWLGLSAASLADYLLQPESYRFGTEVGGWLYRSRLHYLGGLLVELLVLAAGLVLSFVARGPVRALAIRGLTLLVTGAWAAMVSLVL
jgi:hypothetical protein